MRRRDRKRETQEKGWRGATVQRIYKRGRQDTETKPSSADSRGLEPRHWVISVGT